MLWAFRNQVVSQVNLETLQQPICATRPRPPAAHDFNPAETASEHAIEETAIQALEFVVFAPETTGLLPCENAAVLFGAREPRTLDVLCAVRRGLPARTGEAPSMSRRVPCGSPEKGQSAKKNFPFGQVRSH